ncbi:MAG: hypothetical protein ACI90V_004051 [Bacillariaceae sp.]|jgi:hypothetical protein
MLLRLSKFFFPDHTHNQPNVANDYYKRTIAHKRPGVATIIEGFLVDNNRFCFTKAIPPTSVTH